MNPQQLAAWILMIESKLATSRAHMLLGELQDMMDTLVSSHVILTNLLNGLVDSKLKDTNEPSIKKDDKLVN